MHFVGSSRVPSGFPAHSPYLCFILLLQLWLWLGSHQRGKTDYRIDFLSQFEVTQEPFGYWAVHLCSCILANLYLTSSLRPLFSITRWSEAPLPVNSAEFVRFPASTFPLYRITRILSFLHPFWLHQFLARLAPWLLHILGPPHTFKGHD